MAAVIRVTRDARIGLSLMILENAITLLTELLTKLTRDNNKRQQRSTHEEQKSNAMFNSFGKCLSMHSQTWVYFSFL
ncbi:hypothetical protein MtrunA17_Chr5g0401001 [Medicago truncatula]|uniref:Uncharacterized protein n=1 Tax=Medicago truncatula TaxID=3880 RepID=A0A396HN35_MEDTR|nr:hypothetical protein MtrunA17_Chr5g0401001 [Medicago truncatula]